MQNDLVALWFYGDHHSDDFVRFQQHYLDNAFTKFLVAKGFCNHFIQWLPRKRIISEWARDYVDFSDGDESDEDDSDKDQPPKKKVKQKGDEPPLELVEKVHQLCKIDKNILEDYSCTELMEYVRALDLAVDRLSHGLGALLRAKHEEYYFPYDDCGVIIHGRYGGSIIIKGKIEDHDVFFCYGDSAKYEIPCTNAELFKGRLEHYKDIKQEYIKKKIADKWRAGRIGILHLDIYIDLHSKKRKEETKEALKNFVQDADKSVMYVNNLNWRLF